MMESVIPLSASARADDPAADDARNDGTHEVRPDVAYQRLAIVNVVFYGPAGAGDRQWVLIDAGLPATANSIAKAAAERFGANSRPAAIILTHGHFDHVSALAELSARWDAPVYAHSLELPYLDGRASYPPPDPTVGGGLMSLLSPLFPRGPVNVGARLQMLPADGGVPSMPGWRWLHTPGHAPGHVSLWRESDRTLIVGDAFVTTAQESAYAAAMQTAEMHGPPMYFTPDWTAARESVRQLAALKPELVVTGHGRAMQGTEMRAALHALANDFDRIAVPGRGKYVRHPATADNGAAYHAPTAESSPASVGSTSVEKTARALGWFSVGLGLTEVLATKKLTDALGMDSQKKLMRAFGLREIAAGVGILSKPRPTATWLWARVGGDILDIAALLAAFRAGHEKRRNVGVALVNVAAITALDIWCARQLDSKPNG